MSIYRRGRIWWIKLATKSGRIRRSAGTTDKKAAQEYHEKVKGELWRNAKLGDPIPVTWGDAVAKWLKVKTRSGPERYMLSAFEIPPKSLLPLNEPAILKAIGEGAPGTFNRKLGLIVAVHNAAKVTPAEIDRPRNPQGRLRWLTAEEWKRLRAALEEQGSALLLDLADFSIATGVRENNALGLEWSQVDLRRRVAWFYGDQMKGKVAHGIPLNDDAMAVLRKRQGCHKVYVFPNPETGKPYVKASNRAWYMALRKSKLKGTGVVWHTLRHTWASWFVMNGGTLQELMALGGWKSYAMVLKYAHLATEHLAGAAARVKPISLRYNGRKKGSQGTTGGTVGA